MAIKYSIIYSTKYVAYVWSIYDQIGQITRALKIEETLKRGSPNRDGKKVNKFNT